jgi:hypothetical protein
VASSTPPALHVHLQRFEIAPGKLERWEEWMQFQADLHEEVVATLQRERTYLEAIFRDRTGAGNSVYWLTIKGEGGATVESSPLEVDRIHLEFWNEVIRPGVRVEMKTESTLIPAFLLQAIATHAAESASDAGR